MNRQASFRGITRRALRVNYVSPNTCVAALDFASGSSDGSESIIDFVGVFRTAGPVLEVSEESLTNLRLEWTAVPQAGFYRVFRATSQSGPFTLIQDFIGDLFYTDVPPGPGEFFYYVTAIEPNSGETEPSNVESGFVSIAGGPSVLGFSLWVAPESSIYSDTAGTSPAVSNGEIRFWQDLSGHANHPKFEAGMLAGAGPRYSTDVLNGLRLVTFGDSISLNSTGLITPAMSITNGVTIFTVARFRAPSIGSAELAGSLFSYDSKLQARRTAGVNRWSTVNNVTAVEGLDPSIVGVFAPHVMAFRFQFGVGQSIFRDGALVETESDLASVAPASGKVAFGFREDSATEGHLSALVAEKIVYPHVLSDEEVISVSVQLSTKYAL